MSIAGAESGAIGALAARSPQQMRDQNAAIVLDRIWDAPEGAALTASEIIDSTGLTRATVLAICSDLRELGWVVEDRAPSAVPGRGRQARRFAFNAQRRLVIAADIGLSSVTCVVADLHGVVLGRVRHLGDDMPSPLDRTEQLMGCIAEVLALAQVDAARVGAACIGVAASVDRTGVPLPGDPFWENFRIDLARLSTVAPWPTTIENDADLAATAEFAADPSDVSDPLIALLSSDRFGAGLIVRGELLRGAHGATGEMAYLDYVRGVDNPYGLSLAARLLVDAAHEAGRPTVLGDRRPGAEETVLQEVFDGVALGDTVATEIVTELVERLALTISTFAQFVDPARVVVAGGVAATVAPLLPAVRARLAELLPFSPVVESSTLGRDVVLVGAVRTAVAQLRSSALSA
ncbi:ROK family protein [Microbacterium flavum]|uniref:ROK family protein n=1 Tax=Microbacterium flavum TaxID=415216 RepID=UPI0024ACE4DB|nr:ROK family protein [Microbacterium flavum]